MTSTSQPEKPNQMLQNNQNEDVNQTKVEFGPSPLSLRRIQCTHYKNFIYIYIMQNYVRTIF